MESGGGIQTAVTGQNGQKNGKDGDEGVETGVEIETESRERTGRHRHRPIQCRGQTSVQSGTHLNALSLFEFSESG